MLTRRLLFRVSALSLALAALAAPAPAARRTPDVIKLFARARRIVRATPQLSRAIPLEADGTPARGQATTAADIDRWRFVFDNQTTPHSRFRTAFIRFRQRRFGKPRGVRPVFVEDQRLQPLPRMTLANAVARLRGAGYGAPFVAVTLRFPLGPSFTEPLYIFAFGPTVSTAFVGVGTRTGAVMPIA